MGNRKALYARSCQLERTIKTIKTATYSTIYIFAQYTAELVVPSGTLNVLYQIYIAQTEASSFSGKPLYRGFKTSNGQIHCIDFLDEILQ